MRHVSTKTGQGKLVSRPCGARDEFSPASVEASRSHIPVISSGDEAQRCVFNLRLWDSTTVGIRPAAPQRLCCSRPPSTSSPSLSPLLPPPPHPPVRRGSRPVSGVRGQRAAVGSGSCGNRPDVGGNRRFDLCECGSRWLKQHEGPTLLRPRLKSFSSSSSSPWERTGPRSRRLGFISTILSDLSL